MKYVAGWCIPDNEAHLEAHLRETPDYSDQYDEGLRLFAGSGRTAIDVGAHIGLWSWHLSKTFLRVMAFEPCPETADCFVQNVYTPNVTLYRCALGERDGATSLVSRPGTAMKTHVSGDEGPVPLRRLDSFSFQEVDFIKIDCEGFDLHVLQGAEQTIARWHPRIIFESKPGVSLKRYGDAQDAALMWLRARNYSLIHEERGNFCCGYR